MISPSDSDFFVYLFQAECDMFVLHKNMYLVMQERAFGAFSFSDSLQKELFSL